MSIILSGVNYRYTNRQPLFEPVNLSVLPGEKISIVGNNGTGKSTLLRLIAGELAPSCGSIGRSVSPYYVPQQTDIRSESVGRTLGVAEKLDALRAICDGSANPDHYDTLADDWDIESRCRSALDAWGLPHVKLTASTDSLSGGEKTRLSLAGLTIHRPAIVLLDEPTNHLDRTGRDRLYDYIRTCKATLIVVSHDTYLLNLLDRTCELSKKGLKTYGGNYNFYREQKRIEDSALEQRIDSEQAALRLARKKAQEIAERQQKRFSQGERNKDRLPRILRKGAKDRGETTISKLREKHSDIVGLNEKRLNDLRRQRGTACRFKIDFDDALLHNGKLLIAADGVNFGYDRERPFYRQQRQRQNDSRQATDRRTVPDSGRNPQNRLLVRLPRPGIQSGRHSADGTGTGAKIQPQQPLRPRDQDAAQAGPIRRRHVGHKLQRAERRRKVAALPVLPDDLEPCSRSIYSRRTDQ